MLSYLQRLMEGGHQLRFLVYVYLTVSTIGFNTILLVLLVGDAGSTLR